MSGFLFGLLRAAVRGGRRAYEQSRQEAEAAGQQRHVLPPCEGRKTCSPAWKRASRRPKRRPFVRELEDLKQEFAVLGAMSGTDAAGILRELEDLKQKMEAAP